MPTSLCLGGGGLECLQCHVRLCERAYREPTDLNGALAAVNLVNDVVGALAVHCAANRLCRSEDLLQCPDYTTAHTTEGDWAKTKPFRMTQIAVAQQV